MSNSQILLNISSKYIIDLIFSHLYVNKFYKIIKYNKNFQQKININIEDSLKDYLYNIKIKGDLMTNTKYIQNLMNNKMTSFLKLLFSKKSSLKNNNFSLEGESNDSNNENDSNIFLIKYKGFKINDYPLPSDFESKSLEEKIIILEYNQCYYKYPLNDKNIELIYLINEFRENNNMNKLMCNKNVNLDEFLREKNQIIIKIIFLLIL